MGEKLGVPATEVGGLPYAVREHGLAALELEGWAADFKQKRQKRGRGRRP